MNASARTHIDARAHTYAYLDKELEALLVVLDVGGEASLVAHVASVLSTIVCRLEGIEGKARLTCCVCRRKPRLAYCVRYTHGVEFDQLVLSLTR